MSREDLHDAFIGELSRKVPRRADLVNQIADILKLEKESVYRRMAGKVNFSVRETGILAQALNISLDSLLDRDRKVQWLPFVLASPMRLRSMDSFCDMIDRNLEKIREINRGEPAETGNVYNSLPMEFFISSPLLTKFMFFKWGNYFVQSEEFNDFSAWRMPERLAAIPAKYGEIYNFREAFHIWDSSLIWTLGKEIVNFYRMHVITEAEKRDISHELKELLSRIEQGLNGTYVSDIPFPEELDFYVSSINVGFSSSYYASGDRQLALLQTNFSFSVIENSEDTFQQIKEWIRSFRNISTLLSRSGRIERRLFFENQHKIIDQLL